MTQLDIWFAQPAPQKEEKYKRTTQALIILKQQGLAQSTKNRQSAITTAAESSIRNGSTEKRHDCVMLS